MKRTVGCFDRIIKESHSVRLYIIAVHSVISVESLCSACLNSLKFAEIGFIFLFHCVIVVMLRRCQNLRRRTWHKMADLDLEVCLIFDQ